MIAEVAPSELTAGRRGTLWLDTRKLHLFNPADDHSLTRAPDTAGAAAMQRT
jgi:hypothetical protein